jgi:hypothetical protein
VVEVVVVVIINYYGLSLCTIMDCMHLYYGLYGLLLWTTMDFMDYYELYGLLVCTCIWFEMNVVSICSC